MLRRLVFVVALSGLVAGPPPSAGSGRVVYTAPVRPVRVARGFEPPPGPYAAGHRGVDLAVPAGGVVRSAAAGTVSFAGAVAGRGVVVVRHADGISTEYEPVRARVAAGATVGSGQVLGRVAGSHGTCPPDRCLHWGARRDGVYLDPLALLRPLGPVRLLPWAEAAR
jgi:murein DD-endopeptidase MepM/ murein hydrolase activator NlpD